MSCMEKMEGEVVAGGSELVAFFFPRRLGRGAYFVRHCAFSLLAWGLIGACFPISESDVIGPTLLLLVCIYFIFWVVLPRMRDLSIRPFWLILLLVPLVDVFFGLVLLFRRSVITFPESTDPQESHGGALTNR
jgi:hypothetical protein